MKTNYFRHSSSYPKLLLMLGLLMHLACSQPISQDNPNINLTKGFTSLPLNKRYYSYSSQNDISIHQIAQIFKNTSQGADKTKYNDYLWLYFTINNNSSHEDVILEINNNYLHQYQLYEMDGDNLVLKATGGIAFPYDHRQIKNRRFIETLNIPKATACSYILKIDDRERETSVSLRIWNVTAFNKTEARDLLFYNLYFGGLVLIAVFSLFIGLILKMKVFYAYSFYALMMAWFMFDNLGFAYSYFYPNHPDIKRFLDTLLIAPLLLSFVHFGSVYFNTRSKNPILSTWIKIYYSAIGLYILAWAFSKAQWVIHTYLLCNYTFVLLTFIIQIAIVVQGFRHQRTKACFFMSAILVLLVGAILFALSYAGHIPYEWFPTNPLLIGSVIEFGIFSIALIYEIQQINKTKNNLLIASAEHQKNLLTAYIEGTEKERARLSAELHDNVGSRLALLKHKLSLQSDNVTDVTTDLDQLYKSVRSMSHELSPHEFEIISLQEYLKNYLDDFQNSTCIKTNTYFYQIPGTLNREITRQIFRIVQEAILNIQKHAQATIIDIQIISHTNELILTIDDDGQGFDANQTVIDNSHGLFNMRSRCEAMGGSFEISSSPSKGTHIVVSIPFEA